VTDFEMVQEQLSRLAERVYRLERAAETAKAEPSQTEKELEEWIQHMCGRLGDHTPMKLWHKFLREERGR
jgi:hypothetical protein